MYPAPPEEGQNRANPDALSFRMSPKSAGNYGRLAETHLGQKFWPRALPDWAESVLPAA